MRCGGDVALEGQLFHDAVANELLVEIDLGALARAANVQEDALALKRRGNFNGAPPPGDAVVGAVSYFVVGGFEAILIVIGAHALQAPEILLHRARQRDGNTLRGTQRIPAAGGRVDGQAGERDVVRQIDCVVFPLGLLIGPHAPARIGNGDERP